VSLEIFTSDFFFISDDPKSQNLKVSSPLPLAKYYPQGLYAKKRTHEECPLKHASFSKFF